MTEPELKAEAVSRILGLALDRGMMADEWPAGFADQVVEAVWSVRAAALAGTAPADPTNAQQRAAMKVWDESTKGGTYNVADVMWLCLRAALGLPPEPDRQQCAAEVTPGVRCQRKAGHPGSCVAHRHG